MQPGEATVRGAFWRSATAPRLAAMLASGVLITTLVSTIYGGTSEIQRGIIAKTLGL
jgi:hypothetical protein